MLLNEETMIDIASIYFKVSLFHCILYIRIDYGLSFCRGTCQGNQNSIVVLQKNIVQLIKIKTKMNIHSHLFWNFIFCL